jgi:Trypsin-co-occurring domain 1
MAERLVGMDLGEGVHLVVAAEQKGPQLVSEKDIVARLAGVTKPIERVSQDLLDTVKRVRPRKATVELSFGIAIEQGQLVALLGKGKGEASITVTFEWSEQAGADAGVTDGTG